MNETTSLSWLKSIRLYFYTKFERWLKSRIPSQREHCLNSRNIMIYPTRFGLSYVGFVILVFLLGTNYQNNIILLLSYLLGSLFISVMLHSFYNFTSLRLSSEAKQQGFADETLYFPVNIIAKKSHYDINVHFTDLSHKSKPQKFVQCHQGIQEIRLPFTPLKRGRHYLGRVTVYSEYSMGFFKSKTVLDFGHYVIAYPKPKPLNTGQYQFNSPQDDGSHVNNQTNIASGTDDFYELKNFVPGESNARTAWKQLAKGQGHYSKHYQASQGSIQWLSLSEMPSNDVEIKLAYLSYLVGELTQENQTFGLSLSNHVSSQLPSEMSNDTGTDSNNESINGAVNIAPSEGYNHQQACLTALALFR